MTNEDLDRADDATIERQLYANRGLAQAAEREAIQLARSVIQIHPDPHRMRAETNDFARRMTNLGMAPRYRLAREMLRHFQCRDAEARALAEQDHQRNFERALEAQRGPILQAHRAQWVERNGAGLRAIAEKLHRLAQAIETETAAAENHERLKQILDDAEQQLGAIKGQHVSVEHKVIRAALAKADPSPREAA